MMIARALVHQPKLLILDEATSALDPSSEMAMRQTLEKLRGRLTILAVSHQKALVEAADRVYRLENGRAVRCSGRPLGISDFIEKLERMLGRALKPLKPRPKSAQGKGLGKD